MNSCPRYGCGLHSIGRYRSYAESEDAASLLGRAFTGRAACESREVCQFEVAKDGYRATLLKVRFAPFAANQRTRSIPASTRDADPTNRYRPICERWRGRFRFTYPTCVVSNGLPTTPRPALPTSCRRCTILSSGRRYPGQLTRRTDRRGSRASLAGSVRWDRQLTGRFSILIARSTSKSKIG